MALCLKRTDVNKPSFIKCVCVSVRKHILPSLIDVAFHGIVNYFFLQSIASLKLEISVDIRRHSVYICYEYDDKISIQCELLLVFWLDVKFKQHKL